MGFVTTEVIHTELLVGNVVGEKDGLGVWASCELCLRKRSCTLIGLLADCKLPVGRKQVLHFAVGRRTVVFI